MSDFEPVVADVEQVPARARHRGVFRDPVVRGMSYVAVAILLLALLTVISALVLGVLTPSGPRTLAEKQAAVTGQAVLSGSTDVAVWGQYAASLIASGQYAAARGVIADGRATLDDSATAEFTLAEARLLSAQGRFDDAIVAAGAAMQQIQAHYDELIAAGGMTANSARINGLPENYYNALLLRAYAYRDMGEWESSIAEFDRYLGDNPTAADILVDRGMVKIEAGEKGAAEEDFRAALRFVADDAQALRGLEMLGVSP